MRRGRIARGCGTAFEHILARNCADLQIYTYTDFAMIPGTRILTSTLFGCTKRDGMWTYDDDPEVTCYEVSLD